MAVLKLSLPQGRCELWQTDHCFMPSSLSWFHWWETAVTAQFINLRADLKLFSIPPAWRNNEEERGRAFGVCRKENALLTYAMMYTLDRPSLKFSTHFKGDTIAVESRLFFTLTAQWAQAALSCLAALCCVTGGAQVRALQKAIYLGLPSMYEIKNIYGNDATAILLVIDSKCSVKASCSGSTALNNSCVLKCW